MCTAKRQGKVRATLAQVTSLSKCYHLYSDRTCDSHHHTLKRSKQFFSRRPYRRSWAQAGPSAQIPTETSVNRPLPLPSPLHIQQLRQIRETLVSLLPSHPSFLDLQLDFTIISLHARIPVGNRTSLFRAKLMQDQWILTAVQGYCLPLVHWPHHWNSCSRLEDNKLSILQEEAQKLVGKKPFC